MSRSLHEQEFTSQITLSSSYLTSSARLPMYTLDTLIALYTWFKKSLLFWVEFSWRVSSRWARLLVARILTMCWSGVYLGDTCWAEKTREHDMRGGRVLDTTRPERDTTEDDPLESERPRERPSPALEFLLVPLEFLATRRQTVLGLPILRTTEALSSRFEQVLNGKQASLGGVG